MFGGPCKEKLIHAIKRDENKSYSVESKFNIVSNSEIIKFFSEIPLV